MLARGILGSGRTCAVCFQPLPNSSGWWRLISSRFLVRTSCHKTAHANGYSGAWPGWAVSLTVPPLTGLWKPCVPGGSDGDVSACNTEDSGLIPGSGRFPGEGNGYPLQYSCLENSMDGGAWQPIVRGVAKSWT